MWTYCALYQINMRAVRKALYTATLKFEYQVQYSSLIGDLCCLSCNMKIKQDIEKSDNPQNNPVFTSDSLSTELIKFHS